jgi:hypothetical protein
MSGESNRPNLAPAKIAREGWSEAFERATKAAPDDPLLPDHLNEQWDNDEWTW